MARPTEKFRVVASLFDRLTDYEPRNSREVPPPASDQRAAHRASVARDLTNLLNVRLREDEIPQEFENARESILAYGIEDFATSQMQREAIRRSIERTVRRFEPRLSRLEVTEIDGMDFTFSYSITGTLRGDVGLEPIVFDADLPCASGRFQVKARQ